MCDSQLNAVFMFNLITLPKVLTVQSQLGRSELVVVIKHQWISFATRIMRVAKKYRMNTRLNVFKGLEYYIMTIWVSCLKSMNFVTARPI